MRRFLKLSALSLLLILAVLYGLAFHYGPQLVYYGAYFGDTHTSPPTDWMVRGAIPTEFRAEDGTVLSGWLWNRGPAAPLLIAYAGNNMNACSLDWLARLAPKSSILLLNHRGYGDSEGTPTEAVIVDDARQALRHYRTVLGCPPSVTLLGFSLGTGVATQVAATEKVAQLILACPFDSALATACDHVPLLPHLIPMDAFRSDLAAPQVRCPVTIFLGERDTIVPPERTRRLAECFTAAPSVELHAVQSGHNDIFENNEVWQQLDELLNP